MNPSKVFFALLCCFLFVAGAKSLSGQPSYRFMSFNIRFDNPNDGPNAWPQRKSLVESMLQFYRADVMGFQEALPHQVEELQAMLPGYGYYGRERSASSPEYCAIFYLKHKFELLDENSSGTFWLSETPARESKGWDAALPRIGSWVRLKSRRDGQAFLFVNTHYDHVGQTARRNSSMVLDHMIDSLQRVEGKEIPVILLGDFNATPDSEPIRELQKYGFKPAYEGTLLPHHGPRSSWSGWTQAGEKGRQIDHIFTRGRLAVLGHGILSDSWSGRFPSDHLPVLADMVIDPVKYLPNAHAHNDYEHEQALMDALRHGFASVEADIWCVDTDKGDPKLIVSHNKANKAVGSERSLEKLYLWPLAQRIHEQRGRVYPLISEPFYLMIDVKGKNAEAAYKSLKEALQPFAWMLEGEKPAVKIFLSGNRNLSQIMSDKQGLLSADGRPEDLGKGYSPKQMPVISQRYAKILKWKGQGNIPPSELEKLRELVRATHQEGKKLRLWASPEKVEVWKVLLDNGVDLINTDKLDQLQQFLLREQE